MGGVPTVIVRQKDGLAKVFAGFKKSDQDTLKRAFGAFGVDLTRGKRNTKGGNWGDFEVQSTLRDVSCRRLQRGCDVRAPCCPPTLQKKCCTLVPRTVRCSKSLWTTFLRCATVPSGCLASLCLHGCGPSGVQAVLASKTDIELQFVEQDTVDREVRTQLVLLRGPRMGSNFPASVLCRTSAWLRCGCTCHPVTHG